MFSITLLREYDKYSAMFFGSMVWMKQMQGKDESVKNSGQVIL